MVGLASLDPAYRFVQTQVLIGPATHPGRSLTSLLDRARVSEYGQDYPVKWWGSFLGPPDLEN